jgi:NADH-quinone oxidoreductase subunit E
MFLSDELKQRILDLLPRYPSKQAVTLPALHIVQDQHRCVPLEAIAEIAELLDLAPGEVLDTMTFYGFFRMPESPLGKTRLWVCRSLACQLRGCDDLTAHLCDRLGVKVGGTTADGAITLETAECIGACEGAPAVLVNDSHVMNVSNQRADELMTHLKK